MEICNGKYTVPEDCEKCPLSGDSVKYGQNSLCCKCPVFNCSPNEYGGVDYGPLVSPNEYREDWAEEWDKFFKKEKSEPELRLFASRS